MDSYDFDLFVIGAGSGGVRAARMASGTGARVGIAEDYRIGGTCVIRGCIPKKILAYASRIPLEFDAAAGLGWTLNSEPSFDWRALIAAKDREIARLSDIYAHGLERAGVARFAARARLDGPNAVQLATGERLTAERILIATGGHAVLPPLPGIELAITSSEAFDLPALPQRVVIVGGGYIALEFASIFNGLGSEVVILHRGPRLLRDFDADIQEHLAEDLRAAGITLHLNASVERLERRAGALHIHARGEVTTADAILFATGRVPNTADLGLEEAGVRLGERGEILVDAYSRTTTPSVFAVGDVTDRINLTPVAIDEAMRFVDTQFRNTPTPVDYGMIPTAVFSTPEVGVVGLTEAEARARYPQVDIYKTRFRPMRNVLARSDQRTFMKLVVDGTSDRVVGCHLLGEGVAEMIQLIAIPLRLGATKADFDATMALHPSAAEELVTLRQKWVDPAEMHPVAAQ